MLGNDIHALFPRPVLMQAHPTPVDGSVSRCLRTAKVIREVAQVDQCQAQCKGLYKDCTQV